MTKATQKKVQALKKQIAALVGEAEVSAEPSIARRGKKAKKKKVSKRDQIDQLAKARDAYFRKMGYGKYAKKSTKKKAA